MIAIIAGLTLRQLLGQRRTLLVALLGLLPVLVAVVARLALDADADRVRGGVGLIEDMTVHLVLPLTALIFGTAALGQEFEDGTAVYLLARPVRRWQIVAGKLLATWSATAVVVLVSVTGTGLALLTGEPDGARLTLAFGAAVLLGALAYLGLFLCLSILFTRALVIGLIYVFVWEAAITALAPGTQYLSIREYTVGIAGSIADVAPAILDPALDATQSLVFLGLVTVLALGYAVRALAGYQLTAAG